MASCDFCQGGELLFLDEQKDSQLEPKEGQLVFFSSGLEPLFYSSGRDAEGLLWKKGGADGKGCILGIS